VNTTAPYSLTDAQLERSIFRARQRLAHAEHADEQRAAWADLSDLIGRRSPAQVERMERAKGLRP
jgi:hypothetical protein